MAGPDATPEGEPWPESLGEGRYHGLALLASGAMGAVFRATDAETGEARAVKVLLPSLASHPEARSRFLAEGRAMQRIVHPNVLEVYDVGLDPDGATYLVMELATGGTLHDRLIGIEAPEEVALRHAFDLLAALEAAHRLGIVHRDVKPANILFVADGTQKLGDFGLAKVEAVLGEIGHRTRTGQGLGTLGYQAPELRSDARSASPRADLYAVGATLFALLRGREPPDLALAKPSSRLYAGLRPALADLVHRSTSWEPDGRPASARDMAAEVASLHALVTGRGDGGRTWMADFDSRVVAPAPPAAPSLLARVLGWLGAGDDPA